MTPAAKKVIGAWFVFAICAAVNGITSDTSSSTATGYEGIAERNIFGLKPPPPPAPLTETVKTPPLKIILTGITTFGGKKALMKSNGAPGGKPGEPAKEQYYILREQEKDGEIEVLQIDEKVGMVRVNNSGMEQTLTFDKDGVKPSGPAAAPVAGAPHPGGVPSPPPAPGFTPNPAIGGFKQGFPPRTPRIPGQAEGSTASPGAGAVTPATAGGFSPVPVPGAQPQTTEQPAIPYEQQLVLMELERERTKDKVLRGELPPIPFTELTPSDAVGARQQNPANPNPTATRPYGQRGPFPQ